MAGTGKATACVALNVVSNSSLAKLPAIFRRTRIDGYMCDVEILWLAEMLEYRVREVGVTWRDGGDSRLQLVRGNVRNVLDLLRIRFARYASAQAAVDMPATRPMDWTGNLQWCAIPIRRILPTRLGT